VAARAEQLLPSSRRNGQREKKKTTETTTILLPMPSPSSQQRQAPSTSSPQRQQWDRQERESDGGAAGQELVSSFDDDENDGGVDDGGVDDDAAEEAEDEPPPPPRRQRRLRPAAVPRFWDGLPLGTSVLLKSLYFLDALGASTWGRYAAVYYNLHGLSSYRIGLLEACRTSLPPVIAGTAWGYVSDAFRARKAVWVATKIGSTAMLLLLALPAVYASYVRIFAVSVAAQLFSSGGGGGGGALLDSHLLDALGTSRNVSRYYGRYRLYSSLSWGLGSVGMGYLTDWTGRFEWNFVLFGALSLATIVLVATQIDGGGESQRQQQPSRRRRSPFEFGDDGVGEEDDEAPRRRRRRQQLTEPLLVPPAPSPVPESDAFPQDPKLQLDNTADGGDGDGDGDAVLLLAPSVSNVTAATSTTTTASTATVTAADETEAADPETPDGDDGVAPAAAGVGTDATTTSTGLVDLLRLLCSKPRVLLFLTEVVVMGAAMATVERLLFLYLVNDLKSSTALCGWTVGVNVLFELPIFAYPEPLLRTLGGRDGMFLIAMACFAFRVWGYTLLAPGTEWYVLPLEALHGVTFACFWIVTTDISKGLVLLVQRNERRRSQRQQRLIRDAASPSLEPRHDDRQQQQQRATNTWSTTIPSFVQMLYGSVGASLGSLLGGWAMHRYGSRTMYRCAAAIVSVMMLVHAAGAWYCRRRRRRRRSCCSRSRQGQDRRSPDGVSSNSGDTCDDSFLPEFNEGGRRRDDAGDALLVLYE